MLKGRRLRLLAVSSAIVLALVVISAAGQLALPPGPLTDIYVTWSIRVEPREVRSRIGGSFILNVYVTTKEPITLQFYISDQRAGPLERLKPRQQPTWISSDLPSQVSFAPTGSVPHLIAVLVNVNAQATPGSHTIFIEVVRLPQSGGFIEGHGVPVQVILSA